MTKFLLSVHVLAAIVLIGPVTVAASLFPRYAGAALRAEASAVPVTLLLRRITRGYLVAGIVVPVFGLATAVQMNVLGDVWLIVSIILTALAAAVLALVVVPAQNTLVNALPQAEGEQPWRGLLSRLRMGTGVFNLLWAVVVVLMIVRPGSTTGA
ncbi:MULTISPECIES: DUF2269 family protein [unclassified Crossiella]|uniref:DUF2269 family protein n=1 Tax=unclassified Crossiella TaxID=2620835 RepID=UPI002000368F|nr:MULTISPECIES: DUF2269 family protein [unclassified Crossiella]MCK2238654.1 DUF2269 family protein [Crossiella sp. S99.2]MCK2251776.1 DUF2269 family protein [Crossiella sp. S99.1]